MDHSSENPEGEAPRLPRLPAVLSENLGEETRHCDTHGGYVATGIRYAAKKEIWTGCPQCAEAELAKERQQEAEKQAEAARARLEAMVEHSAIPARFVGRSFDNFNVESDDQRAVLGIVRDYAARFDSNHRRGAGLILSGLPGTGKSHLAASVMQSVMPRHNALYTTFMGMVRAIRSTWRKNAERSESQVVKALCTVDLLVIDEIGVQYGTDGEQTILFDVLDGRYREMKPTILLTNQDAAGFKQFVGERTYDRLTETSRWVAFDWASYRSQAKKEAM